MIVKQTQLGISNEEFKQRSEKLLEYTQKTDTSGIVLFDRDECLSATKNKTKFRRFLLAFTSDYRYNIHKFKTKLKH